MHLDIWPLLVKGLASRPLLSLLTDTDTFVPLLLSGTPIAIIIATPSIVIESTPITIRIITIQCRMLNFCFY